MSPVELAAVIRKMEAAGESPENIKLVVRHHAGAKASAPAEKPSAASSFGSGVLESAGLPGSVAEARAMGEQALAHPIDTLWPAIRGLSPSGMTQNMLDAVTTEFDPMLTGKGPAPGVDKVLRAILGQTPLGPAAESVSHVGTALGSGDPNDMARAGGNVTGLVLQALLAKGGPKVGKAAGSTLKAVPRVLPDVGPLASALENPALLKLVEGTGGRMASRGVSAGVGGILGGIPGAVAGSELGPLLAKRGAQAPAGILRLLEKASGKDPYLSPGRLGLEELLGSADEASAAAPKAPAAPAAAPGATVAPKGGQPAQIQFADLPESVQRLLNDATKKPAERAIAREAINDARKGDPTRLEHLARQLDAQQPNPVAAATDQLAGLTPDSVAPQPQVPGPAASLEELLRQSIRQRGGMPLDEPQLPAIPPGLASILPDGQRAMPGGRSGTAVSPTSPKLAAPAVGAETDLAELLLRSIAEAKARRGL